MQVEIQRSCNSGFLASRDLLLLSSFIFLYKLHSNIESSSVPLFEIWRKYNLHKRELKVNVLFVGL